MKFEFHILRFESITICWSLQVHTAWFILNHTVPAYKQCTRIMVRIAKTFTGSQPITNEPIGRSLIRQWFIDGHLRAKSIRNNLLLCSLHLVADHLPMAISYEQTLSLNKKTSIWRFKRQSTQQKLDTLFNRCALYLSTRIHCHILAVNSLCSLTELRFNHWTSMLKKC